MLTVHLYNLPPMPRNRSHSIFNNRLVKTALCREFEKDLTDRLLEYVPQFKELYDLFHSENHYLVVGYTIYTPKDQLFTKEGEVSLRAVDCDAHKVMQDVLFDCVGIDDKFIRDVTYHTPVSPDGNWNYEITISVQSVRWLHVIK